MRLRIGTRRSLLATAQTRQVMALLKCLPAAADLEIELVGIDSAGDQNRDLPIGQLGVVGAFSHALDQALLAGNVDLTVHSLKDLGTQRPPGLVTAAIPVRAPQHDMLLLRPQALERLAQRHELVVGSSAPRRQLLLPPVLARLLPHLPGQPARVRVAHLRGNIHSRLEQLHRDSPFDGVVLALAGLERLHRDTDGPGHAQLAVLLTGLNRMLLPLTACPGAPGQGALALETRAERSDIVQLLAGLHHPPTAAQVEAERAFLVAQGGGCHQPFGISTLETGAGTCRIVRGSNTSGTTLDRLDWEPVGPIPPFAEWPQVVDHLTTGLPLPTECAGLIWRVPTGAATSQPIAQEQLADGQPGPVFVAHQRAWHALEPEQRNLLSGRRLWVSGLRTWLHLAQAGCWVEGCAEGLGFGWLESMAAQIGVLALPADLKGGWTVLTHAQAASGWMQRPAVAHVLAPYRTEKPVIDQQEVHALHRARYVLWSSPQALEVLQPWLTSSHWHLCGAGKTAQKLRQAGLEQVVELPLFAHFNLFRDFDLTS